MCQALLEIMEPEINKIIERVRKETEEKVRKEAEEQNRIRDINIAKKMIASGKVSVEKVKEFVPGLSVDEIKILEKELTCS